MEKIAGQPMKLAEGDVRDTVRLTETLKTHVIDAVIHFAGLKAVGESVVNPIDYYATNIQGTISLLQAMQSTAIKTLWSLVLAPRSMATRIPADRRGPLHQRHQPLWSQQAAH